MSYVISLKKKNLPVNCGVIFFGKNFIANSDSNCPIN